MRIPRPQHPFHHEPWGDLRARFHELAAVRGELRPLADIVDSVVELGASNDLAGSRFGDDLVVAAAPIPEPPYDVVRIYAPDADHESLSIEQFTEYGPPHRVELPAAQAVPVFWRFVAETFAIRPHP